MRTAVFLSVAFILPGWFIPAIAADSGGALRSMVQSRVEAEYASLAAGLPEERMPIVTVGEANAKSTYNDPALTRRLAATFETWLGKDKTMQRPPVMASEDFAYYGRTEDKIPCCIFWAGAVEPARWQESERTGAALPSLHSSQFHPLIEPTLKTAMAAMSAAVLELAGKP